VDGQEQQLVYNYVQWEKAVSRLCMSHGHRWSFHQNDHPSAFAITTIAGTPGVPEFDSIGNGLEAQFNRRNSLVYYSVFIYVSDSSNRQNQNTFMKWLYKYLSEIHEAALAKRA
jgi:hypothetical protein